MYHIISLLYVFITCIVFLVYFLTLLSLKAKISDFLAVIFRYSTRLFVSQKHVFLWRQMCCRVFERFQYLLKHLKRCLIMFSWEKKHYLFVFNSKIFFLSKKTKILDFYGVWNFFGENQSIHKKLFFAKEFLCDLIQVSCMY